MLFREDLITDSRKEAALNKKQTPLKLFPRDDTHIESGIFASSEGGFYETTLEECTCPDFAIHGRLQPCKHMIRLAMEFGLIDSTGMETDRDAALVKYHVGFMRDYVQRAELTDVIAVVRLFIPVAEVGEKIPDNAFAQSMDLACVSDCPIFKVQKNGTVKIEKKYTKDAQGIITVMKHRIGDEALVRLWNDDFVAAFIKTEV